MNTHKFRNTSIVCAKSGVVYAISAATLLAVLMTAMTAAANADTEKTLNCLPTNQIKRTKIVDDQNIIFYMPGNKSYNNHLPNKCSGLKWENRFLYKTSINQLCNVDIINVLHQDGTGFTPGAACGLGDFQLIEKPVETPKTP